MLVNDRKRELLELDGQIDPFEIDVLGHGDGDRGEVENPFDSGGNQGIGKDLPKAKQYLQKSCDLGATSACDTARGI